MLGFATLVLIGIVVGVTTVLFGFGGGFVTVPIIAWADHRFGAPALHVATATSLVVMVGNALVATLATPRSTLAWLTRRRALLACLCLGGLAGALAGQHTPAWVVRWGFVAYIVGTLLDLLLRRGFLSPGHAGDAGTTGASGGPGTAVPRQAAPRAIPTPVGLVIGFVATLLGVGGSVLTVPALRRSGASMATATSLANPLTLVIVTPAAALSLAHAAPVPGGHLVGPVDLLAALALLLGALPVVVWLRRHPPRLDDRLHAVGYVVLVALSALAVALT